MTFGPVGLYSIWRWRLGGTERTAAFGRAHKAGARAHGGSEFFSCLRQAGMRSSAHFRRVSPAPGAPDLHNAERGRDGLAGALPGSAPPIAHRSNSEQCDPWCPPSPERSLHYSESRAKANKPPSSQRTPLQRLVRWASAAAASLLSGPSLPCGGRLGKSASRLLGGYSPVQTRGPGSNELWDLSVFGLFSWGLIT